MPLSVNYKRRDFCKIAVIKINDFEANLRAQLIIYK